MLSAQPISITDVNEYVKWYCIHLLSERQYQDWVVQQSSLKTVCAMRRRALFGCCAANDADPCPDFFFCRKHGLPT